MDVGFETGGGYRVIELSLDCTTVESYIPRSGERGAAFLEDRTSRSVPRFSRFASSPESAGRDRAARVDLGSRARRGARGPPRGGAARVAGAGFRAFARYGLRFAQDTSHYYADRRDTYADVTLRCACGVACG